MKGLVIVLAVVVAVAVAVSTESPEENQCPKLRTAIDSRNGNCKQNIECPENHKCCYWMCIPKALTAAPTEATTPRSTTTRAPRTTRARGTTTVPTTLETEATTSG